MDRRFHPSTTEPDLGDQGAVREGEWLVGGGELGGLIRSLDWSMTPLGARDSWPGSLRTLVSMLVASPFAMALLWGPDLIFIYNDAYRVIAGGKHPAALGRSTRDIWSEVWHINEPIFAAVMDRGETLYFEDALFPINRNGFEENAYFTLGYSPARDGGVVGGTLVTLQETTAQVLERRRAATALQRGTALLQAISDTSADVIFAKDRQGRIQFANPATLALVGKPLEAVLGKTDAEFLGDLDAARQVMENDRRIMESGVAEELEERVPLPDGSERVWLSHKVPYRDPSGAVLGLLGMSRDITEEKRAEVALRQSEERYRTLFANMTEGFALGEIICDPAGAPVDFRFVEMNEAFERQSGLSSAATRGRSIRAVLPNVEQSWIDTYGAVALGGAPHRFESYNGDLARWFSVYCFSPAPGRFAILFTDVSERRRAEEAVRASEERLRLALDAAHMTAWEYDPDSKRVKMTHNAGDVLGLGRGGGVHEDSDDGYALLHPEDVEKHRALVTEAVETVGSYVSVYRHLRDGEVLWLEERARAVADPSGRTVRLVGVTQNVTERKRIEEALRTREAQFEALVEELHSGVALIDSTGQFTLYNRSFLELFGLAADADVANVNSQDWSRWQVFDEGGTLIPVDEHPVRKAAVTRRAVTGQVVAVRLPSGGGLRWMVVGAEPMLAADGSIAQVICTYYDITDRKRAEAGLREANEKLQEADRRKDEFLGMLSHELRNPLAPIRNALYILDRAAPGGEQARRAREVANRQVTHMTRLVDDLLDVTRIARGKIELRRAEVDVAALARRTSEDHRAIMADRRLELDVRVPPGPVLVDADPTRIAQVLGNLLHNAGKFTPPGGRVTLAVGVEDRRAVIRVRDTGPGIAPDVLPTIFEPFTQAKQTLARSEGGLGLGLALVKGIVDMHGGDVRASSAGEGHGTEFVVTLPFAARRDVGTEDGDVATRTDALRRRVLVIDDNRDAADTIAELVGMLGHDADVAYDAHGGLAKVSETMPDVVLCDIGLPGMDGYEFARQLRALAGKHPVRLVAVSGYAQPEDVAKALDAGFDAHVAKPPDPDQLAGLLS
jgi:PAS domain S-box-containing protein